MLYITIVAKSTVHLTISYLFFNKIQKKQLIKTSYCPEIIKLFNLQ
ncbi:hypothetical protein BCAH1134_C0404 (plasmid) [Bacillus cereus AH1134]|nr:hypothetical protein BCAH1134_C0404 [Bacillus cereus AH1134]